MEIRNLLKSQANDIFAELTSNGWNPADFEWKDERSRRSSTNRALISKLVHKPSGFWFTFDNANSAFYVQFSPAAQTLQGTSNASSWDGQLSTFHAWLGYLKRETEAPDLWNAISQEPNLINSATSDTDNALFSAEEKHYILSGLNEIKQYLLTAHRLDPELVEGRINYLIESSERLGRKDWKNLLLATLVSIIINAALPSDTVREIFVFVGTVLRRILVSQFLLQ
jgi:hypothetical protein